MIYLLNDEIGFPDPREGDEDGLFALGGDLSMERLLLAYSYGIFPWYAFRAEDTDPSLVDPETGKPYIQWWCPMRRFVIFPDEIHVSHSMRQELKRVERGELRVTMNRAFHQVIDQCGRLREEGTGAWLGDDMKQAYCRLHEEGFAASVEVWRKRPSPALPDETTQDKPDETTQDKPEETTQDKPGETANGQLGAQEHTDDWELVGGLYGVTLGRGFYGESMFSLMPSASKVALVTLAGVMKQLGVKLIDCQFETPHLRSMGGRYIDYEEYLRLIRGT